MDAVIAQISDSVTRARSLEELTRPLLQMLQTVTGLESTYLTTVDFNTGLQQVVFANNSRQLQIPEGAQGRWDDALCKRAIEDGRLYSEDVPAHFPDNRVARELGLQTYISTPVHTEAGELYGTLCGASTARQPVSPEASQVLRLFAGLIEQQIAREQLVTQLQQANAELLTQALTDPLTGLLNRRALMQELERLRATARRAGQWLLVGTLDLDGFKAINDEHGHEAGDALLRGVALAVRTALRGGDVLARVGGDEFVVAGLGPQREADGTAAAAQWQERLAASTAGQYAAGERCIRYAGASVGVVALDPQAVDADQALRESDAAMYRVKASRRAGR
ncbi:MAG: sensor domain-containing diguanylate cyclase [Methylotenera sp.]|jgi:diguanylate cyclase|nr:sensor domain-containing diguanylate cyclase [Methylotenera sp.]